ncbi:hypothetical protein NKH18_27445 [Streptomyces sp. M10(2022)]
MSTEEFAGRLGVSDRMVSKWESRKDTIRLRQVNQAALDTLLASSAPDVHERFASLARSLGTVLPAQEAPNPRVQPQQRQVRHPATARAWPWSRPAPSCAARRTNRSGSRPSTSTSIR